MNISDSIFKGILQMDLLRLHINRKLGQIYKQVLPKWWYTGKYMNGC